MADPRASDHDRLQAAKYVLDKAGTCVELDALEDRCGVSPCRIKYAIKEWRRFVLTAVTGRPAKLIRRLPNKLTRMAAVYVVYDVLARKRNAHRQSRLAPNIRRSSMV